MVPSWRDEWTQSIPQYHRWFGWITIIAFGDLVPCPCHRSNCITLIKLHCARHAAMTSCSSLHLKTSDTELSSYTIKLGGTFYTLWCHISGLVVLSPELSKVTSMKINDRELVSCWLSTSSWCTVIKYFIILININQPLILFFASLDLGGCGGGNLVETGTVSSLVGQLSRFGTVMIRCHGIMMIFTIPVHSSLLLQY